MYNRRNVKVTKFKKKMKEEKDYGDVMRSRVEVFALKWYKNSKFK